MSQGLAVGLLGFGEVGAILADDLLDVSDLKLLAFDRLFDDADSAPSHALRGCRSVGAALTAGDLAGACDVVISAVTAAEDVPATQALANGIVDGTFVLDLNSVAPETKRRCADVVTSAGGRYVEAALMASIGPERIRSPVLLGGPHAVEFLSTAIRLGFTGTTVFSAEIGPASAAKMCRSVIVKGMESLLTESLLAARHYGVERHVLDSLRNFLGSGDWFSIAPYLIGRSVQHGGRRAEEMQEAAATVVAAGVEPLMSRACAARQELSAAFPAALEQHDLQHMLDTIRRQMEC